MALETKLDWADARFAEPLDAEGVETLLAHLAQRLPARIEYVVEQGKSVGKQEGDEDSDEEDRDEALGLHRVRCLRSLAAHGTIYSALDGESATFRSSTAASPILIFGLRFETIAGYRREEHRPEQVAFIDRIKEKVSEYFC